ncbi:MAG TPA: metalloregulator ArsR/SmtB family transcription factor [Kiloniellales bacterium]|nr:metalloregulator ArsR/SmtB family transcription factor [Kiloniellales bacterium]
MDLERAAQCLETLGHPTRLAIFRLLVRAGRDGLAVGEIQERLGIPASTLSHHIAQLTGAGLVRQTREGRILRCTPDFAVMDGLLGFLTEECCADSPEHGRKTG